MYFTGLTNKMLSRFLNPGIALVSEEKLVREGFQKKLMEFSIKVRTYSSSILSSDHDQIMAEEGTLILV